MDTSAAKTRQDSASDWNSSWNVPGWCTLATAPTLALSTVEFSATPYLVIATVRNLAITILRLAGHASIGAALRYHAPVARPHYRRS